MSQCWGRKKTHLALSLAACLNYTHVPTTRKGLLRNGPENRSSQCAFINTLTETHTCMWLTTRACNTHRSLIILPCISMQRFHSDCTGWSKAAVADGTAGFPSHPPPAEALQHSDFTQRTEVRKSLKPPEAFLRRVFTALVNVLVLGKSGGGLWWRCAEQSSD